MQLNPQYTVSFIKGLPPLLCKRLLYYSDPKDMFRQARGLPMLCGCCLRGDRSDGMGVDDPMIQNQKGD